MKDKCGKKLYVAYWKDNKNTFQDMYL